MGEKSVQKKRYIVEKARDVFMEKGFKKVTMKDIVEACQNTSRYSTPFSASMMGY